jgi:hypothetical protein|tara:strand:- start:288 stop:413 length:126 start_codon:yes stop_codon:yes gene_type:complete
MKFLSSTFVKISGPVTEVEVDEVSTTLLVDGDTFISDWPKP